MRTRRVEWGSGPQTLVLVHGYSDDADTWWQVGPALADLGWHVVALDLLGHGTAPRADSYSLDLLVDDLVEAVGPGADVVLGHSLGAVLVNLAGDRLRASQVVLVDPPWGTLPADLGRRPWEPSLEDIRRREPGWADADVRVDHASSARLDPAVTAWLAGPDPLGREALAVAPAVPTVLVLPEDSLLVPAALHAGLRDMGFSIRTLPGVGHVVHRDDPVAFVRLVAEVLDRALDMTTASVVT